jgi:hypothetical protein
MFRFLWRKVPFILANIGVMIILHGNSKQFWPRIPYLSLRDESIPEHSRLLFNTLLVVTLGQVAIKQMPLKRVPPRVMTMGILPLSLPLMIGLGHRGLGLEGKQARIYHLSLVLLLPVVAAALEDGLVKVVEQVDGE